VVAGCLWYATRPSSVQGSDHAPPALSTIYVVPVTPFGLAAGHPLAAAEGVRILERGGSAAEAAIAVAFMQGVVDPAKCGIGGWGVATYFEAATGILTSIDAPGRAGSAARPEMWVEDVLEPAYHGYLPRLRGAVNDIGYRAIATPGAVALYAELYRLGGGRFDWGDLVAPAIRHARDGVEIESGVLGAGAPEWDWPGAVSFAGRLAATPAAMRAYLPGGRLFRVGELLRQPDLAATLETVASDGHDAFYSGSIAARIADDFRIGRADITAADLAAYRPTVRPALERAYGTWRVGVPWPPESGVSLLALLGRLEGRLDTSAALLDAANLEPLVEALEFIARQRAGILGDPAFVDVPVDAMLAEARTGGRRPAVRSADQPGHTTSVVVVDAAGNAVAMNQSLASHGGSGVMTDGLGFLYNNCMAGFDVEPGRPNSIAPGKARWSAACPAIAVAADGRHRLALTGPGATRAIAAVAQGVLQLLDFGRTAQEAAASTRIDAHDGVIDLEDGAPSHIEEYVARLGRTGARVPPSAAAALYLVARSADGRLDAAADPRRPGSATARQD
jgi:gamma-glutamyltranspeptidase / glutathione hydrolase